MTFVNLMTTLVVAPNLHRRYSGITSVVITIVPELVKHMPVASLGPHLPPRVPRIRWWQIFTRGWTKPLHISSPHPTSHGDVGNDAQRAGARWVGKVGRGALAWSASKRCPHPNPPPRGEGIKHKRIWHARRNDEMIVGLILRDILRQPWLLVFTSTAQRHHTAFTRWLMRRMDGLIAGSALAARYVRQPAVVIDNSIETARFSPAQDRLNAWQETGLPGRYGIGVFGRVRHQKGTDIFVEAMIELLPQFPLFTAVIVGLCAQEQKAFTAKLLEHISAAHLQDRIVFLGERAQEDVPLWFRRLTVYVAPMRWEGFGLTPIEAMASGVAVVATKAGAHEQIVVEGETGHLIPPGDAAALIKALRPLMADPEKAWAMGQKGRVKALRDHDVALEAEKTLRFYNGIWAGQPLPDERPRS